MVPDISVVSCLVDMVAFIGKCHERFGPHTGVSTQTAVGTWMSSQKNGCQHRPRAYETTLMFNSSFLYCDKLVSPP